MKGDPMNDPKQQALQFYTKIITTNPDLWFEVISHLYLLAARDHFGYQPMGLDPEAAARLDKMQIDSLLRRR